MPVIGLSFTRIDASRKGVQPTGEMKINSTPKITEVKEIDVRGLDKKALSMEFEFGTKYDPDVAEIRIEGNAIFMAKDNATVLKQWDKDKSLPD